MIIEKLKDTVNIPSFEVFICNGDCAQQITYLNERDFSDGAINVRLGEYTLSNPETIIIEPNYWTFDILELELLVNAIRNLDSLSSSKIIFNMKYLPYARQDRHFDREACALNVFIKRLNNIDLDEVVIFDIHNKHFLPQIKNHRHVSGIDLLFKFLEREMKRNETYCIIFPDKGAYHKYKMQEDRCLLFAFEQSRYMNSQVYFHHFKKERINGSISSVSPSEEFEGFIEWYMGCEYKKLNIIVYDDICDGGATFIKCAEHIEGLLALYNKACIEVDMHLRVTHGIFSKGCDELAEHFNFIGSEVSYDRQ